MGVIWKAIKQMAEERLTRWVQELASPDGRRYRLQGTPRKGETFGTGFTTLFHRGAEALFMSSDLTAYDYRLVFLLTAGPADLRLGWDSYKPVVVGDVIAKLGGSQSGVSRSMMRLVDLGFLERENRGGGKRVARYRLHEHFTWRGSTGAYWRHVADRRARDHRLASGAATASVDNEKEP